MWNTLCEFPFLEVQQRKKTGAFYFIDDNIQIIHFLAFLGTGGPWPCSGCCTSPEELWRVYKQLSRHPYLGKRNELQSFEPQSNVCYFSSWTTFQSSSTIWLVKRLDWETNFVCCYRCVGFTAGLWGNEKVNPLFLNDINLINYVECLWVLNICIWLLNKCLSLVLCGETKYIRIEKSYFSFFFSKLGQLK